MYTIVEEVPGLPENELFYIRYPDGRLVTLTGGEAVTFATTADARHYLRLLGVSDDQIKTEPFTP